MLTDPTIITRRHPTTTTVSCHTHGCGGRITLAPGEGVYPVGSPVRSTGTTTKRQVQCHQCGESSTLQVTRAQAR